MRNWTDVTGIALLVLLGTLWAVAKIDFFMRSWRYYEAENLRGYVLEHWPFWASMALIGVLLLLVRVIERRKAR